MLNKDELDLLRADKLHREHFTRKLYEDAALKQGIHNLVKKYNSNVVSFDDLFQNTIVLFIKTVVFKRDIQEMTDVRAYAYVIARNRLYSELKSKAQVSQLDESDRNALSSDDITAEKLVLDMERKSELRKIISLVGDKCQQVLMYWSAGYSMEEIAERMNYKSAGMAKKKKYECLNSLLTLLEKKPAIKQALLNLRQE